jgi:hypothetical protein
VTDKTYWAMLLVKVQTASPVLFETPSVTIDVRFILPSGLESRAGKKYESVAAILADGWEPFSRESTVDCTRWVFRLKVPEREIKWVCTPDQVYAWVYGITDFSVQLRLGDVGIGNMDVPRWIKDSPAGQLALAPWIEQEFPVWRDARLDAFTSSRDRYDNRLRNAKAPKVEHVRFVNIPDQEETP